MANVHERIRDLRGERGLTQAELAKELNITHQVVSFYEKGREPNYETLIKICDFFDVSIDYLLGRSDFKNFNNEYDYRCRIRNEHVTKTFPETEQILISINEHFSSIIHDLIENREDRFSTNALVAFNQLLRMILYIKETLGQSFSDMRGYIDLLKLLINAKSSCSITLDSIEFSQTQVKACKRYLNEFIHLYVLTIFDFENMKLKEGANNG